jgi:putative ABC transport system ATP-binding protein
MIHCTNIAFEYPNNTFGLKVSSLEVNSGETVAIIGPSGCGKTTLIQLLAGILTPHKGSITVNNLEITNFSASDRQDFRIATIGLMFQEFELLNYLTVLDNILLPFRLNPILTLDASIEKKAVELAIAVGLEDKLNRYPKKLSQGERQRVAVCRALISNPKVLLCDEPTANLDPDNRNNILDILFTYAKENNTALVMVTHDQEIWNRFDRIIDSRNFIG